MEEPKRKEEARNTQETGGREKNPDQVENATEKEAAELLDAQADCKSKGESEQGPHEEEAS